MVKNFLVVADLGAAGNLLKNLLLLSDNVDWPLKVDRFGRILKQYSKETTFESWLDKEYSLRFWTTYYGIDLSDDLNWSLYCKAHKKTALPAVFLNHSAFYQIDQFLKFQKEMSIVYICPTTDWGYEWQARSYCEKKSVEKLHDFTFPTDAKDKILQHVLQHGQESYYKLNIDNMKCILKDRQQLFQQLVTPISLESIVVDDVDSVRLKLTSMTGIDIDSEKFTFVLNAWRSLHWDVSKTYDWKYGSPS